MNRTEFKTIKLSPSAKRYYPASSDISEWSDNTYIKHTEVDIPLGKSRYGGPIVDLPDGVIYPEDMRFAGQLDLAEISKYDQESRLPKSGQLIFFSDIVEDKCQVIYADVANEQLKRSIVEHEENFWDGVLIENIASGTESWSDHYRELNEGDLECNDCGEDFRTCGCDSDYNEFEPEQITADNKVWDDFAGFKQSKMFGFFTHCQWSKEEIEEELSPNKVVLLQIGENGFNDEGVFLVLIKEDALKNRDFSSCNCYWSQT